VPPRNWAAFLLLAAAVVVGCSGSNVNVNLPSGGASVANGEGVIDVPPIETEVRGGEIRGITPTPAWITPIAAMETPVPTATPKPR